jgi:hypothetical protein
MPKKALLVGIDKYDNFSNLTGCIADVNSMKQILQKNEDHSSNYGCKSMVYGEGHSVPVTKTSLKAACRELFDYSGDVLFYFSGHGALSPEGGYLATADGKSDDWGVSMEEIVQMANNSRASDILLILDCCHAGDMGDPGLLNPNGNHHPIAALRENMTIIAAARNTQAAMEAGGHGLFTTALLDALDGGAADHMGWITAPAIYSYVERRFNEWSQRPIYKSNASILNVVRKCAPLIDRLKLEELPLHFPTEAHKYQLDPEYEPEDEFGNLHEPVNKEKVRISTLLKEYRDAGLVRASEPGEQFYWAAQRGHTVELTLRGREYWRLVKCDRL